MLVNLLLQQSVEIPTCIMERMHLDDPLERSVSTGGWLTCNTPYLLKCCHVQGQSLPEWTYIA